MAQKSDGAPRGIPISSLSLPTANTARQHLGSRKKSDTKEVHPGYNMFDWTKLCNSGRDMSGTKGKLLKITAQELAQHSTDEDLWTAVRGVVYNVTLFAKYHPGGKAQLMRGAGQDCTELFDKIHVWVNSESILEKCTVGVLVGAAPPKKAARLSPSISKPPFSGSSVDQDDQGQDVLSLQVPGIDLGRLNISEVDKLESDESPNISVQVSVPSNPEPATSTSSSEDSRNTHISRNPLLSKTAYETGV